MPRAEITKAMLALERKKNELDQTIWAKALFADKHEEVFIQLWDRLRSVEDPFDVLTDFTFGSLRIGTETEIQPAEHEIQISSFSDPMKDLEPAGWKDLLTKLKAAGYRLEQSDWRLSKFNTESESIAHSDIALTLNVVNTNQNQRFVVRGNLHVTWKESEEPLTPPFPELIDASGLEVASRRGDPMFQWTLSRGIVPEDNPVSIDPLIVYDLDGNGLSEIILACQNRVYWNLGNGRFQTAPLCQYPGKPIYTGIIADFSGDGLADFLAAATSGLLLFAGDKAGKFNTPPKRVSVSKTELLNPFVMTAGDIDKDGDLDVWLAQYKLPYLAGQMPTPYYDANDGFPSYLLINNGDGGFRDHTESAGLAENRFRRTYSSSFVDLDDDSDLDLVVVSDFAGVDLYYNDGTGVFSDVTSTVLSEPHVFGMAHTFGDYNMDGRSDLFVIGMNSHVANRLGAMHPGPASTSLDPRMRSRMAYGNRMYFARGSKFEQTTFGRKASKSGWSWGATSFDFDNDADLDVYIVNGHKSRVSARDYETQFWRHDIYVASSAHDEVLDLYFRSTGTKLYGAGYSYGGYYKNRLLINQNAQSFLEAGYLAGSALEADCRNVVSEDLNGDGKVDLIVTTNEDWPEPRQGIHLFQNQTKNSGNWIGIRLRESGPGYSPVGTKIVLRLENSSQKRLVVTGDSYRSQHSNTAHFGIGKETHAIGVEVTWPNGETQRLLNPAINRYHSVMPKGKVRQTAQ